MITLYNPFETFRFSPDECFLTGKKLNPEIDNIPIFPKWIIERYSLQDKVITMLAENAVKYQDLKIPCDPKIIENVINPLESRIEKAFTAGYEDVVKLPQLDLFQWISKLVYGMLYNDIVFGIQQNAKKGLPFSLSKLLTKKITNLQSMLQSLIVDMQFEDKKPWSIEVVSIESTKDIFNYKDETKNLNFSLAMNDFGIIACLQDNGENSILHKDLLQKIEGKTLHPIQFEELWSKFLYSNYLLKTSSEYEFIPINNSIQVKAISLENPMPLFNKWDDKMYAQVLANYWKPWGLTMKDIINFPNSPISYLIDEYENTFIEREKIDQPF
jgi:hypothetical protein